MAEFTTMTQSFASAARRWCEKVLQITDKSLNFMHANKIYSMRRSIEVFISDSKCIFRLAELFTRFFSHT